MVGGFRLIISDLVVYDVVEGVDLEDAFDHSGWSTLA